MVRARQLVRSKACREVAEVFWTLYVPERSKSIIEHVQGVYYMQCTLTTENLQGYQWEITGDAQVENHGTGQTSLSMTPSQRCISMDLKTHYYHTRTGTPADLFSFYRSRNYYVQRNAGPVLVFPV